MSTHTGLFTDFYSLTMMQGYYLTNRNNPAVFDMFFRKPVNESGFEIFAGLESLIHAIYNLRFSQEDIAYLREQQLFTEEFLQYLKTFHFSGNIWAIQEGSICFPYEPIIKVQAPIIEAQLIEGLILNTINFQTLIATTTARICIAAKHMKVIELGLRRAQGPNGALYASRAAYIGGIDATSNVLAGKEFRLPTTGTMAHAWVMSYPDELQAFEDFSKLYPNNITLLLDTHDTLKSGLANAIKLGTQLKKKNISFAVRLDSGDLEYLSQEVRTALNNVGLHDTKIIATNDLDETIISQLVQNNAPIDIIGIGTKLVTGGENSALSGVYKLAELHDVTHNTKTPLIKTSDNIEKSSLPLSKDIIRFSQNGKYQLDLIIHDEEQIDISSPIVCHHPYLEHKKQVLQPPYISKTLLQPYITNGNIVHTFEPLKDIKSFVQEEISNLDKTHLRLINPHTYHVSISNTIKKIRDTILFKP